jgi:hypothetical protein
MMHTREVIAQYSSDDDNREAVIFDRTSTTSYKSNVNSTRAVAVSEQVSIYTIDFIENRRYVGSLSYPDKSLTFVERAAENWVTYVMEKDTIKRHGVGKI